MSQIVQLHVISGANIEGGVTVKGGLDADVITQGGVPVSGTVHTDSTLTGNGSSGSPLHVVSVSGNWQSQMYGFAKSFYSTIGTDFIVDFVKGTNGDYVVVATSGSGGTGTVTISQVFNGGVVAISSAGFSGGQAAVVAVGQPAIVAKSKTGAPWFYAARARITTTITATSIVEFGPTTAPSAFSSNMPWIGVQGSVSTAFISTSNGTTGVATSTPVPTVNAEFDVAIGFDGVTLTYFYGDILQNTLTQVATSTTLSNFGDTSIGPASILASTDTNTFTTYVDKIYMATAA